MLYIPSQLNMHIVLFTVYFSNTATYKAICQSLI